MFLGIVFVFGLLFGSFASVVITRLKSGQSGTLTGRSMCPHCHHMLGWKDLIPIFSWVLQKGRCRYCTKEIPVLYPLLELSMGIVFVLCGYFLIDSTLIFEGNFFEWIRMLFLCVFCFLSLVYVWYDILYLEIPETVLLILISMVFLGISIGILFPQYTIFSYLWMPEWVLLEKITALIFWILFLVGFYTILWGEYSEWIDLGILLSIGIGLYGIYAHIWTSGFFWSLVWMWGVFTFFFLQIFLSGWRWMWGWDLRIALLLWLISWPFSVVATMSAYIAGSIIGIGILTFLRLKWQKNIKNVQIPFGPFLAIGMFSALFWWESLYKLFFPFFE